GAGIYSDHFSAEQLHSENIERLSSHIFCADIDDATQIKQCANRRSCYAVLARPSLSNDATLAHSTRKQRLSNGVVHLVRARVQKIFALQIDLRSPAVSRQPLRVKQRRWPATVIAQQFVEFAPEIWVLSGAPELVSQLIQRRH